ncbi:MAG: response regulator [Candidatus Brocadiia bacterium]|jgi:DNA-binding NtrC family response regulator
MKVLAIDDQAEALKQIEKALSGAKGPDDMPYEVMALADHHAALELLTREHFDVIVTDMVMGNQEKEGLEILREMTGKSPITIVLTAYPSIPNCVAAMRAGAWDYLEKTPADGSDPYEILLNSVSQACRERLARPEAGRVNPDATWVKDHYEELTAKYAGKIVAVLDGKVVDEDENYGKLAERVKRDYPVAVPTLVLVPDTKVDAID